MVCTLQWLLVCFGTAVVQSTMDVPFLLINYLLLNGDFNMVVFCSLLNDGICGQLIVEECYFSNSHFQAGTTKIDMPS